MNSLLVILSLIRLFDVLFVEGIVEIVSVRNILILKFNSEIIKCFYRVQAGLEQ
jgi:hypothetical protein